MELTINIYDEDDNIVKTCTAELIDIKFGQIAAIMELIDLDEIEDSYKLLKTIRKAWNQLKKILSRIFPDMEEDDWEFVSMKELLPIFIITLKNSAIEMMKIPKSKNA